MLRKRLVPRHEILMFPQAVREDSRYKKINTRCKKKDIEKVLKYRKASFSKSVSTTFVDDCSYNFGRKTGIARTKLMDLKFIT